MTTVQISWSVEQSTHGLTHHQKRWRRQRECKLFDEIIALFFHPTSASVVLSTREVKHEYKSASNQAINK